MTVSVADVMRRHVIAVRERATPTEIMGAMRRFHLTSMPVVDDRKRVIGLISASDLPTRERGDVRTGLLGDVRRGLLGRFLRGLNGGPEPFAADLMRTPVVTVTATTPAREAAREMYRYGLHRLPVVDAATGRLIGIITRSDLLAVYERPDADIRHEILHDIIEHTLRIDPGKFAVSVVGGTVMIRGRLERRSDAVRLSRALGHVGGVLAVVDHLTYRQDDTRPETGPGRPSGRPVAEPTGGDPRTAPARGARLS